MQSKIDNNYLEKQYSSLPFIVAYLCHTKDIALFKCVKKRFERKVKVLENNFHCLERKLFFEAFISIYELCQEKFSNAVLDKVNALQLHINDSDEYTLIFDAVRLLLLGYKIQNTEPAKEIMKEIKEIDDTAFSHEFREALLSCFNRNNEYNDKDVENFNASSITETHKNRILDLLVSTEEKEFQDISFDMGVMDEVLRKHGYSSEDVSTTTRRMNEEHESAVEETFSDSLNEKPQRTRCIWTEEETKRLVKYVTNHAGRISWKKIPKKLHLDKTHQQCHDHFKNLQKKI